MAVLGAIFLLAALVIAGFCLWAASMATTPAATVNLFDNTLSMTPTTMFLLGALSTLLLLLGIWLAFFATKRRYRSHKERRTLEKREKEQAAELEETRAKLGRQGDAREREQPAPPRTERPTQPTRESVRREEPAREPEHREEPVRDRQPRDEQIRDEQIRDERDVDIRPGRPGGERGEPRRGAPHGDGDYLPPREGR